MSTVNGTCDTRKTRLDYADTRPYCVKYPTFLGRGTVECTGIGNIADGVRLKGYLRETGIVKDRCAPTHRKAPCEVC